VALDVLPPEFIDAVPADPFTGGPLHYKRLETGYMVYSVNKDQTDDGGVEPSGMDPLAPGTDVPFTIRRQGLRWLDSTLLKRPSRCAC
jgi:hypothetical protein